MAITINKLSKTDTITMNVNLRTFTLLLKNGKEETIGEDKWSQSIERIKKYEKEGLLDNITFITNRG